MCPNPIEHYKMTRSFESLKQEYDLLHSAELADEELQLLTSILSQENSTAHFYIGLLLTLSPFVVIILYLYLNNKL